MSTLRIPDARQHRLTADDCGTQPLPGGDEEFAHGFGLRRERAQHQHAVDQRNGRKGWSATNSRIDSTCARVAGVANKVPTASWPASPQSAPRAGESPVSRNRSMKMGTVLICWQMGPDLKSTDATPATLHSSRSSRSAPASKGSPRAGRPRQLISQPMNGSPRRFAHASRCARRLRDRRCFPAAAIRASRPRRAVPASARNPRRRSDRTWSRPGRDQRMSARVHLHVDAQLVATDHTARRMHEIDMTGIAFGIEGTLNDERPAVMTLDERVRSSPGPAPFSENGA